MDKSKNINIAIITKVSLDKGLASTYRILQFAQGFSELGHNAKVYSLANIKQEDIPDIKSTINLKENPKFLLAYNSIIKKNPKNIIGSTFVFFKSIFNTLKMLKKDYAENRIDVLYIGNFPFMVITSFIFFLFAKKNNIKYVHERNEHPNYQKSFFNNLNSIFYRKSLIFFNAIVLISESLGDYYKTIASKKIEIFVVPPFMDPKEFFESTEEIDEYQDKFKIVYCGALSQQKDGILTMLEAISIVKKKYANIKFIALGDTKSIEAKNKINKLVESLDINEYIDFKGYLPRKDYVKYMKNADMLALAKPTNLQNEYCMPQKITEYIATEKPFLVTKSPNIEFYLKDGENIILAEPDSSQKFAEKIIYFIENYEAVKEITKKSHVLSNTEFNYKYQSKRLIDFFYNIK
ncbi:MAG: hypothetical protein A2X12_04045 [Bacteroidetes bacterium GWE2_29_8]|nr:MAG: hypothetical protein A2X12_04045 [Bacteroidetes bacterium GWE2_29_8]